MFYSAALTDFDSEMDTVIASGDAVRSVANMFNERSWTKQGTWRGTFLWYSAILESFSDEWTGKVLDRRLAIKDYACIGQAHGEKDCLIGASCFEELRRAMQSDFALAGPSYFLNYAQQCEDKCNQWLRFAELIAGRNEELEGLPNPRLRELMAGYLAHLRETGAFMDTIIVLADVLGDVVGQEVDALLKAHNIADPAAYGCFLQIHSESPLPTNITLAERSLSEIARQVLESDALRDLFDSSPRDVMAALRQNASSVSYAIERYVDRFGWMNTYSFAGQPYTADEIVQFVQERLDPLGENIEDHRQVPQPFQTTSLAYILNQTPVPDRLRHLLSAIRTLTYVNTVKDDVHQITWQKIQPLMHAIANRLGCDVADLTQCTPEELLAAISCDRIDRDLLESRSGSWALLKTPDSMYLIQGNADMQVFRSSLKSLLPFDVPALTGRPIFSGKVSGIARIVLRASDCSKVAVGDILVATNANTDFIPAMRRAAAFVTDTGNLICHAVIAAREFKKPCVIGTQIATQILKDGERLEVDGSTGAITRLDFRPSV